MKPLLDVTVVLVNYNQSRFFADAWSSLNRLTIRPAKIFVVDDGSTNDDVQKIQATIDAQPLLNVFQYVDGINFGISKRLNLVLPDISTKWLLVLAADDMLAPSALEIFSSAHEDNVEVFWGNLDLIDELGHELKLSRPRDTWQGRVARRYIEPNHPFDDLLRFNNFISGGMTLISTAVLRDAGGWDPQLTTEDFDLWLRIGSTAKFKYVDESVGKYRIVQGSKSRRDSHKLIDQAKLLGKQSGVSSLIDRNLAYLAAMRWAFTIFRTKKLPVTSLAKMAEIMSLSPWLLRSQLPRAIWVPVFESLRAKLKSPF